VSIGLGRERLVLLHGLFQLSGFCVIVYALPFLDWRHPANTRTSCGIFLFHNLVSPPLRLPRPPTASVAFDDETRTLLADAETEASIDVRAVLPTAVDRTGFDIMSVSQ
jgi:hypothetical protein